MEYRLAGTSDELLAKYAELFRSTFPHATHLNVPYLHWLYAASPRGKVVGFDAWEGNQLAGHYACTPTTVSVRGTTCNALLSLNTATHPDFRGKGLFTQLARQTYAHAADQNFSLVYGVANAQSTPGFGKMGFRALGQLEARIGFGDLNVAVADRDNKAQFFRRWDDAELNWRTENPANRIRLVRTRTQTTGCLAYARHGVRAWAEIPSSSTTNVESVLDRVYPRVFLGRIPCALGSISRRYIPVPDKLRPSPLNLIAKDLREQLTFDAGEVFLHYLDFDAF